MAAEVPIDFWKICIAELKKVKHFLMLAEGEKPKMPKAGFDATYTCGNMHMMKEIYKDEKSVK